MVVEVSQVILWVQIRHKWKLFPTISVPSVDCFDANLSSSPQLVQNVSRVELLVPWVQVIWLSIISALNIFDIKLVSLEEIKDIAHVPFQQFLRSLLVVGGVSFEKLQTSLVRHVVTSQNKETSSSSMVSPILRILLNLRQILLREI